MKITIDTKEDSSEEIKKVIQILSHFVKEEVKTNTDLFSNEQSESSFANVFSEPEEKKEPESGTLPDFSGFNNLVEESKKEEKDSPQVISY